MDPVSLAISMMTITAPVAHGSGNLYMEKQAPRQFAGEMSLHKVRPASASGHSLKSSKSIKSLILPKMSSGGIGKADRDFSPGRAFSLSSSRFAFSPFVGGETLFGRASFCGATVGDAPPDLFPGLSSFVNCGAELSSGVKACDRGKGRGGAPILSLSFSDVLDGLFEFLPLKHVVASLAQDFARKGSVSSRAGSRLGKHSASFLFQSHLSGFTLSIPAEISWFLGSSRGGFCCNAQSSVPISIAHGGESSFVRKDLNQWIGAAVENCSYVVADVLNRSIPSLAPLFAWTRYRSVSGLSVSNFVPADSIKA